MGDTGSNHRQLPAQLETAVIKWADASADLAAVLRQIDFNAAARPPLRLVQPSLRPRAPWRGLMYIWP
jgi:hypothetical protein